MDNKQINLLIDPDPNCCGILLSDRINFYANNTGMIDRFDPEKLKPASYVLTIGNRYYINDKAVSLKKNEIFLIPKNGLAYIKIKEKLNLPFYIAANYNLRTKQTLRGFLMGTGLQVDPGYSGHLYVPIYNFTDDKRELQEGEELISMEFHKTTKLGEQTDLKKIATLSDVRASGVKGKDGNLCKIYPERPDREFIEYYDLRDKNRESAVLNLQKDLKKIKFIGYSSIGANVIIFLASLAIFVTGYVNLENTHKELIGKTENLKSTKKDKDDESEKVIKKLSDGMQELKNDIKKAEEKKVDFKSQLRGKGAIKKE